VSASAVGYYGDRGETSLTEESAPGTGFLAEVCREWEAAADSARAAGIRVVHPRLGVVLAGQGGALPRIARPFRLGVGGVIGGGRQYWSWIGIDDLVRVIELCLQQDTLVGPVNAVAPAPVTNRELTRVLSRILGRPALVPLPAPVVRLLLGEMGQALLLDSARVVPRRLEQVGFRFQHSDLESALRAAFARSST
jgi:uncharacterized protein (TIGR01777 family)